MKRKSKKRIPFKNIQHVNKIILIGPLPDDYFNYAQFISIDELDGIIYKYSFRPTSLLIEDSIIVFIVNPRHNYPLDKKEDIFKEFSEFGNLYFINEESSIESLGLAWDRFPELVINVDFIGNFQKPIYKEFLNKIEYLLLTDNSRKKICYITNRAKYFEILAHLNTGLTHKNKQLSQIDFTNILNIATPNLIDNIKDSVNHRYNKNILLSNEDYLADLLVANIQRDLITVIESQNVLVALEIVKSSSFPIYYRKFSSLPESDKIKFWEAVINLDKIIIVKENSQKYSNPFPRIIKTFTLPDFLELSERKYLVLLYFLKFYNLLDDSDLLILEKIHGFDKLLNDCKSFMTLENAVKEFRSLNNKYCIATEEGTSTLENDSIFWFELSEKIKKHEDYTSQIQSNVLIEKPKTNMSISFEPISKIFLTNNSSKEDQLAPNADILTLICLIKCYQNGYQNGVPPKKLEMLFKQYEAIKKDSNVSLNTNKGSTSSIGLDKRIRQRIKTPKKDPAKPQKKHNGEKTHLNSNVGKYRRFTESFDLECGTDKIMFKNFSEFQFTIEDPDFNDDWINTLK